LDNAYLIRIIAFVGAYYLRIMSQLQIETVCIQCQKHFLSKKKGSRFCSNVCRAQYSRDGRLLKLKSQSKIIKTQAKVIDAVLPKNVNICSDCEHEFSEAKLDDVLREINNMTHEAQDLAVKSNDIKERWSKYVSDPVRYSRYLGAVHYILDNRDKKDWN
jgi:hypothetical protein